MTRNTTGAALLIALALAASGCGKAQEAATTGAGDLKTGPGITDDTIALGAITDTSGPFAPLGSAVTQGEQLYFDEVNAEGGICGRTVELVVKDMGYDVQRAVAAYAEVEPQVAGFAQLFGSPMIAALKDTLAEDQMYTAAISWASSLLEQENVQITGATYDIEMINGIAYLVDEGMIKKGDTIGHIHLEGEYGDNGLAGSTYAAEKLGLTLEDIQVKATETDMTSAVNKLKGAGVTAIMLTTSGKQTASIAGVAASSGLDVPLLGNNPAFSPLLLETAAGAALERNLYVSGSIQPLSSDDATSKRILEAVKAKFPDTRTNAGVLYGYAVAPTAGATLEAACEAKDLSRTGLIEAFRSQTSVDTQGIMGPLDYSTQGAIPSRQTRVVRPSRSTLDIDGLVTAKELFESPIATEYTPQG
jgi:ABC-type branched-subunit amino acid transport system substrate-binding protein